MERNRVIILLGSQGHGSGAERVLEYFLAGNISRREDICLLSPATSSVTTFARNLGYAWIPWETDTDSFPRNLRACWKLLRKHGRTPPGGLIHSWHTRHLEWAWALGRLWNIPCAGTIHDDPSPAHGQFGRGRKWMIRAAATRLTGVVAVSSAIERRCAELDWKCVPMVIRNGLPDAPPTRREAAPVLRLGFLAATVLWKGITLLPELVRRMADSPVEWHLFGSPLPETVPFVEQLSRMPHVSVHGQAPLEEALRHIDVLLHLSLALDPYPTVLLEAARAGIPIVASDLGGSLEIVDGGRTGILVKTGDADSVETAIRRFLGHSELRAQMGHAARERFEMNFRVAPMVADYFAFWDRLRTPHEHQS